MTATNLITATNPLWIIPRTFCGKRVGALSRAAEKGDGDPLDVCVVSERPITKSEVILDARVVGGLQMIDAGEADDNFMAVLANDNFWEDVGDISELPEILVERLHHSSLDLDVQNGNVFHNIHEVSYTIQLRSNRWHIRASEILSKF